MVSTLVTLVGAPWRTGRNADAVSFLMASRAACHFHPVQRYRAGRAARPLWDLSVRVHNPVVQLLTLPLADEWPGLTRPAPSQPQEVPVLVAVASSAVREAVAALMNALEGFRVVAEVDTHDQAIERARTLRPTLAVIDQDLPPCGGAWTLRRLRDEGLVRAQVAIGLRADSVTRACAAAAGASAYVQTGAPAVEVLAALETALRAIQPGARPEPGRHLEG